MTGQEALEKLIEGNKRFIAGDSKHPHENAEWRKTLISRQNPYAVIVGCSDSRVPVEMIFDQGFGDLFVVRVAGNIVHESELGSILYAVEHTDVSLVFVLGHENCGAITAAISTQDNRQNEAVEIQQLLSHIDPAIKDIDKDVDLDEKVHKGVEVNVDLVVNALKKHSIVAKHVKENGLLVLGGVYELDSGAVRIQD